MNRKRTNFIKKTLKLAFPDTTFKVKTDTYSLGSSIDINWIDGPTTTEVEELGLKRRFESVARCEITGEILAGGNRYYFHNRSWSPASEKLIRGFINDKMQVPHWIEAKGAWAVKQWKDEQLWRIFCKTSFNGIPAAMAEIVETKIEGGQIFLEVEA